MIDKKLAQKLITILATLLAISLPISRAGINIFGFLIFVVWILEENLVEKVKLLIKNRFTLSLIIFLLYQIIALLWVTPNNLTNAIDYSFKYVYFLIVLVLYTSFNPKKINYLIYGFLFGMLITTLESISIYFHLSNIHEINKYSLSPHMWHTIYSIFLAFTSLITLLFLLHNKNRKEFAISIVLFFLSTTILLLGIGRTGQTIFAFGLVLIVIIQYGFKLKYIMSILLLIIISFITLYNQNHIFKERVDIIKNDISSIDKRDDYCSSIGGRIFTWHVAYDVFNKEPMLGLGASDHTDFLEKAKDNDDKFSTCNIRDLISYYHSQYIELITQSGIVGLISLLYIFYSLLKLQIEDKTTNDIKIILIFVFLTSFLVDVPFRKMFTLALFAIFSSIVAIKYKDENRL